MTLAAILVWLHHPTPAPAWTMLASGVLLVGWVRRRDSRQLSDEGDADT